MINRDKFVMDKARLTDVCLMAYEAHREGKGIFKGGIKKYLPQWNLPEELEYSPKKETVKNPELAANYLWLMALLERRSLTRVNMRYGLETWKNEKTRWIFDPLDVASRNIQNIREICSDNLHYGLNDFPQAYQDNAIKLISEYDGNSRNIINGKTFEQAKNRLMEFRSVGTGISNLFPIYLLDRKIATITDNENCLIKVDIHKSRIPVNTGSIEPAKDFIRRDNLVAPLEEMYSEICEEQGLNHSVLDGILWSIGSNICVKKDYKYCVALCPLEELCLGYIPEDDKTATFQVYERINGERKRVDQRKNRGQQHLPFHREF